MTAHILPGYEKAMSLYCIGAIIPRAIIYSCFVFPNLPLQLGDPLSSQSSSLGGSSSVLSEHSSGECAASLLWAWNLQSVSESHSPLFDLEMGEVSPFLFLWGCLGKVFWVGVLHSSQSQ